MTEDMGRTNIYSPIPPEDKEYILVLSSCVFIMSHFSLEWPVFNQYRQEGLTTAFIMKEYGPGLLRMAEQ